MPITDARVADVFCFYKPASLCVCKIRLWLEVPDNLF